MRRPRPRACDGTMRVAPSASRSDAAPPPSSRARPACGRFDARCCSSVRSCRGCLLQAAEGGSGESIIVKFTAKTTPKNAIRLTRTCQPLRRKPLSSCREALRSQLPAPCLCPLASGPLKKSSTEAVAPLTMSVSRKRIGRDAVCRPSARSRSTRSSRVWSCPPRAARTARRSAARRRPPACTPRRPSTPGGRAGRRASCSSTGSCQAFRSEPSASRTKTGLRSCSALTPSVVRVANV